MNNCRDWIYRSLTNEARGRDCIALVQLRHWIIKNAVSEPELDRMMMVVPVMSEPDSIVSELSWVNENEGGSSDYRNCGGSVFPKEKLY